MTQTQPNQFSLYVIIPLSVAQTIETVSGPGTLTHIARQFLYELATCCTNHPYDPDLPGTLIRRISAVGASEGGHPQPLKRGTRKTRSATKRAPRTKRTDSGPSVVKAVVRVEEE